MEEVPDTVIDAGAVNDLTMNLKFESNPQETVSADSLMSNNSTIFEDLCLKSAQLADVMGVTNCWLVRKYPNPIQKYAVASNAYNFFSMVDTKTTLNEILCGDAYPSLWN